MHSWSVRLQALFISVLVTYQARACPRDCFCAPHSKNVQCSNQNLLYIPDNIATETLELNLNENKFQQPRLSRQNFSELVNIHNLYLSETGLETIAVDTFADLTHLSWLDISRNNIRYVADFTFRGLSLKHLFINDNPDLELSPAAFAGMTTQGLYMNHCGLRRLSLDLLAPLNGSLKTLWLHGNKLGVLGDKWRSFLRKLAHIRLGENAFHCNCQLSWLHTFYMASKSSLFAGGDQPRCASPSLVQGKNFDNLTDDDFRCQLPAFQNVDVVFDSKIGKLTCLARGDPAPTLTWVRPDGLKETFYLKPDHEGDQNMALMLLAGSKFENKQAYTCVAANAAGNVTFSLNVVWPDTRSIPPPPAKAAARAAAKLSKPAVSSVLAEDATTSGPYQGLQQNYVGDDSDVYGWKGQSDRSRMCQPESAAGETQQREILFGLVDVAGAVLATFILTLLVTVTLVHFYCRARLASRSSDVFNAPGQINNQRSVLNVYVMDETKEDSGKLVNPNKGCHT